MSDGRKKVGPTSKKRRNGCLFSFK